LTRYPGARLLKRLQASCVATWRSASCARRSAFGSTGFRERRPGLQLSADYASHRRQYKGRAINSAPRRQSFGARKQVAGTEHAGYCIANWTSSSRKQGPDCNQVETWTLSIGHLPPRSRLCRCRYTTRAAAPPADEGAADSSRVNQSNHVQLAGSYSASASPAT